MVRWYVFRGPRGVKVDVAPRAFASDLDATTYGETMGVYAGRASVPDAAEVEAYIQASGGHWYRFVQTAPSGRGCGECVQHPRARYATSGAAKAYAARHQVTAVALTDDEEVVQFYNHGRWAAICERGYGHMTAATQGEAICS